MSDRSTHGIFRRIVRRTAVLAATTAATLAVLAAPAQAAQPPGTCFTHVDNSGQAGVAITFPTVQLAPGTAIKLTVTAQTGSQPQAHAVYFWDGTTPNWQYQLSQEIFGGEWRQSPIRVNDPGQIAAFIPAYNATIPVWFVKEYYQNGQLTGVESPVEVRMADGGPCHSFL
jgi:hypothetical protein